MWFFAAFLAFARSPRVPQRRARHDLAQRPRAALHFNLSSINCIRFSRGQPFVSACQLHALAPLSLRAPFQVSRSQGLTADSQKALFHIATLTHAARKSHARSTMARYGHTPVNTPWDPWGRGGARGLGGAAAAPTRRKLSRAQPSSARAQPELSRAQPELRRAQPRAAPSSCELRR